MNLRPTRPSRPAPHALLALAALAALAPGCAAIQGGSQANVLHAKNKVAPALVHIRPVKEVYTRGRREEVVVIGSGFIISPDGYVVTNEHVAGESRFVKCVLSNKDEVDAQVVGADPYTDLAVLKLDTGRDLPYVRWADPDGLEAGQTVMALGSPHGLARSVSLGIISVTDRHLDSNGPMVSPYNNWIQTDAAINPGNSGGPLINLRGEVVGVNSRVLSGAENVGFAIPVDIARDVTAKIIATGRVQRADLGMTFQEMLAKTEDREQQGVVIADIDPLAPAYAAGVQPGDTLLSVDGQPTNARFEEDLPAVRRLIANLPVGQTVQLALRRGNESLTIPVLTEELSPMKGMELEFPEWGFTARALTPEIVRLAQLPSRNGVFVSGAQVGGVANEAGLGKGDIILTIDGEAITDLAAFQDLYRARVDQHRELVMLLVKRGALTRFVLVKQKPFDPLAKPADLGAAPAPETPDADE